MAVDCGDNETSEGPWLLSYEVEVARDEGVGFYVAAERLKAKDSSSAARQPSSWMCGWRGGAEIFSVLTAALP